MGRGFCFLIIGIMVTGCSRNNATDRDIKGLVNSNAAPSSQNQESKAAPSQAVVQVKSARPGQLALPDKGGVWPWPVGPAPAGPPPQRVSLTQAIPPGMVIVQGAAINSQAGKAVIMFLESDFKKKYSGTCVSWCDLTRGQVVYNWRVKDLVAPFDLHRNGRQLLVRATPSSRGEKNVLELWTVIEVGGLSRKPWEAFGDDVKWAGFVGRGHIAAVANDGELKIWRLDGLQKVGAVQDVVGLPAVTPDGNKLAFLTENHVALFDPAVEEIIGMRRIAKPPDDAVLAFRPDGKMLACAGTGRSDIIDLTTGQRWSAMIPDLKMAYHGLLPDFGWAGDQHLYHKGDVYDLFTPIPVWRYQMAKWASARGGSTWVIAENFPSKEIALLSLNLPHPAALAKIETAIRDPNLFALRPGDAVRVDVSGLAADQRKEIKATLERRVKELGYRLDPAASVVFLALEEKTGTPKKVTYNFNKGSKTFSYTRRQARLQIVKAGQVLWETADSDDPPFIIMYHDAGELDDKVAGYGSPDYGIFTNRPIPGVIRAKHKHGGALGWSSLRASGIQDHF